MDPVLYYDYGLPFSRDLAPVLDALKHRVMIQNKASFFIIDGGIGSGKSIGGVQFADYLNGAYIKKSDGTYERDESKFIDLESKDQYSLGAREFMKKLVSVYQKNLNVLIYDEAGDFSKRQSLTQLNNDLNRIFEICRAFKIIIIIILPNFYYIDRSVIDKEMIRGLARIDRENALYSNYRIWDLWGISWIKYRSLKLPIPNQCYNYQSPIQRGHILPLDPQRMDLLDQMSRKNKISIATDISNKKGDYKGVTKLEIIDKYKMSPTNLNIILMTQKVKTIAPPPNYIGNANYYNPVAVDKAIKKHLADRGGTRI